MCGIIIDIRIFPHQRNLKLALCLWCCSEFMSTELLPISFTTVGTEPATFGATENDYLQNHQLIMMIHEERDIGLRS